MFTSKKGEQCARIRRAPLRQVAPPVFPDNVLVEVHLCLLVPVLICLEQLWKDRVPHVPFAGKLKGRTLAGSLVAFAVLVFEYVIDCVADKVQCSFAILFIERRIIFTLVLSYVSVYLHVFGVPFVFGKPFDLQRTRLDS